MSDPPRKVKNTLFNASVTGGTFEDFSQNALLLPAMEKPPPPVVNFVPESILQNSPQISQINQEVPAILNPVESIEIQPSATSYFQQQSLDSSYDTEVQNQNSSNLSSVLSSFSNYLKIGSKNNQTEEADVQIPTPTTLDSFIGQNNINAPPVPLFSSSTGPAVQTEIPKPPIPTGTINSFRKAGSKRPVYAQLPGLTSNTQHIPPPVQQNQPFFTPLQHPSSVSPASSTSSIQEPISNLPNQFKPISPFPTSFSNIVPQIPYPQHSHSLFQNTQGPVMDSIPASEALPSQTDSVSSNFGNEVQNGPNPANLNQIYRPVYQHWFFNKQIEGKIIWQPFSMVDSLALEHAFTSNDLDPDKVIPTDGGRYDVNILRRQRLPVYWKGNVSEIRRCSWFHRNNGNGKYIPYDENIAKKLEEEYKMAFESKQWQKKVTLDNGEVIHLHGPDTLVVYPSTPVPDAWGNTPTQPRPSVVKRGLDEFDIDEGEPAEVDHLLFMVHGIGSVCDLKFRPVEEVVDEFRSIALQLVQSHYKSSCERGVANRVEVLPISWHQKLHSEETGVDNQLKSITLESIPRLRDFTNDTLLDVLFYTSPLYCQTIISSVGDELNRIFAMFNKRNPTFKGGVSLAGHSLGSLILFDLLAHQRPNPEQVCSEVEEKNDDAEITTENNSIPENRKMVRRISYMMGRVGAGVPKITYPHLDFHPKTFFALGSPIGMFITVRGLDKLGDLFSLPTCPAFFNIFHPYDPVAYRIEALIKPDLGSLKPVLIPHHKGRKRMHLELKETMAKVGADLKQKLFDSMKTTWNSFYQLAMFHRQDQPALEAEVTKTIQQLETTPDEDDPEPIQEQINISIGNLNGGRRIDYVLQEAPLEFFNEYIFALTSHVCYWNSEDTILMILKEIYTSMNVATDDRIPQQTMTIERPPSSPKSGRSIGVNPTYPVQSTNVNLQPPPKSGFVKKT